MLKKITLRISILIISVIVALLACELLVRILPIKNINKTQHGLSRSHLIRGFESIPNISITRWGGIDWEINSKGFRDYKHKIKKEDFRILVLGDSYFAGNEVSFEDSFLRKLERSLDIEVIKMGVGAYGTIQERLLWEEEGIKYNPDLVLLGVYLGNDLQDNAYFPNQHCVYNGYLIDCSYDLSKKSVKVALYLAGRSLLARLLLQKYQITFLSQRKIKERSKTSPEEKDIMIRYDDSVVSLYSKKWGKVEEKGFKLLRENILILKESVENLGAKLIVIIIPLESQIYDWQWEEYAKSKSLDITRYNKYKVIELLVDFLKNNNIRFINLLPMLKEAGKTDSNLHPGHWHWSVKANKLIANTVQDYLEKNQLITHN